MSRLVYAILISLSCTFSAPLYGQNFGQNRSAELDKAYEEARSAYLALQEAEKRRDAGLEPQSTERSANAGGGSTRLNEQYFGRQAQLEQEVDLARKRYDAALKRWNDLK